MPNRCQQCTKEIVFLFGMAHKGKPCPNEILRVWEKDMKATFDGQQCTVSMYKFVSVHDDTMTIKEYISYQEPKIQERLAQIKKCRTRQFPYKAPFTSIPQLRTIITDIRTGKL